MIQTHSLSKQYGRRTALDGCTLEVRRGEVFGLLGPNGAGKTTLLRLLLGFLRPSSGTAQIDGFDCYRDSLAAHARTAYLPGEARLFRAMRGRDVLVLLARIRPDASLERSLALADRMRLDLSPAVAAMSTGMRQKLALSAVLSVDAPLLILDEPTSNLDPTVRRVVLELVSEARASGRTVVFSSHVLAEVEQACDRVAILRQGQLVHTQAMSELRRRHRVLARLTGPMPSVPENLSAGVTLSPGANSELAIDVDGDLSPVLGWLATLPLAEVRIEPAGLRAIYDHFHADE